MAAPAIGKRRRWLPNGAVTVNPSHPLATSLARFYLPARGLEVVTGQTMSFGPGSLSTLSTGAAYSFTGSTTGLPSLPPWPHGDVTVAAQGAPTGNGYFFQFGSQNPNQALILQRLDGSTARFAMWFADLDVTVDWTTNPVIAGTVKGSTQSVYVGSILGGSQAQAFNFGSASTNVVCQDSLSGPVAWFALWNRALSVAELGQLSADPFQMLTF